MNAVLDSPGWEQFEKQLRGFIGKRVPADAVDDIYGDVVLRLLAHKDKFEAAKNPVSWIYRVTANRIVDHYRARSREPVDTGVEPEVLEAAREPADFESTPQALEELADCVLPLIRQLPAQYGEALMLTDIDGMKQVDAASTLSLSPSGMKSRVQRGRNLLKKSILDCCHVSVNHKGNIKDFEKKNSCC
jgi:RNA polymerase sigma-70 factor (ECF subfamily)